MFLQVWTLLNEYINVFAARHVSLGGTHFFKDILLADQDRLVLIMDQQSTSKQCVLNVGLFRSGTTSFAEAAELLGLASFRSFPKLLSSEEYYKFIFTPDEAVKTWWDQGGKNEIATNLTHYDVLCDGYVALLPFLPQNDLVNFCDEARANGVYLTFVATTRDVEESVHSELHHWVRYDLERRALLNHEERCSLENQIHRRAQQHFSNVEKLSSCTNIKPVILALDKVATTWPTALQKVFNGKYSKTKWKNALISVGKRNSNPPLPVEGILLTMRIGSGSEALTNIKSVAKLLNSIEEDKLCSYFIVVALDSDEVGTEGAQSLVRSLKQRARPIKVEVMVNSSRLFSNNRDVFPICQVWDTMAAAAWRLGADWIILLGDDIDIHCPYHYRTFYRAFLDISSNLQCPFGFGCPRWNDITFPGFPTFPAVGRLHNEIYGSLIPKHRSTLFINQDLDPYLQRLYLKFGAAPALMEAKLTNGQGGNIGEPARYTRVEAKGWRDWVKDDVEPIQLYLASHASKENSLSLVTLVDVIIPAYRLDLNYLKGICSIDVPPYMSTTFLIIVDNPSKLVHMVVRGDIPCATSLENSKDMVTSMHVAQAALEQHLTAATQSDTNTYGNNIRVRCNIANMGASETRNRGLDESAAEYVLFLDDDVVPSTKLLVAYGEALLKVHKEAHDDNDGQQDMLLGLVGLVRFPRSPTLPLKHAAVLMSYLTFAFEIACESVYKNPAWGVTANILVKRTSLKFDTAYAKTGGGEDVDYCLRLAESEACSPGASFRAVPSASVCHPFWEGSVVALSKHFFGWATGDSALFHRFPDQCFRSFPNIAEMLFVTVIPLFIISAISLSSKHTAATVSGRILSRLVRYTISLVTVDIAIDMIDAKAFRHRVALLEHTSRSTPFLLLAHSLGNIYVIILESGRLYGHLKRGHLANFALRFDWHCGRIENHRYHFRMREGIKFIAFLGLLMAMMWKSK